MIGEKERLERKRQEVRSPRCRVFSLPSAQFRVLVREYIFAAIRAVSPGRGTRHFPAHAGMSRAVASPEFRGWSEAVPRASGASGRIFGRAFPRIRGDEPSSTLPRSLGDDRSRFSIPVGRLHAVPRASGAIHPDGGGARSMRVSVAEPAWMNPHFRACPEAGASRTGRLQPALLALAPGKRIAFTGSGCGAVS